jgi:hypothetical protein
MSGIATRPTTNVYSKAMDFVAGSFRKSCRSRIAGMLPHI